MNTRSKVSGFKSRQKSHLFQLEDNATVFLTDNVPHSLYFKQRFSIWGLRSITRVSVTFSFHYSNKNNNILYVIMIAEFLLLRVIVLNGLLNQMGFNPNLKI